VQKPDAFILAQIKLLNCVGMIYSGDEYLMTAAKSYHGDLAAFCGAQWNEFESGQDDMPRNPEETLAHKWAAWCEAESRRRTGYCIWVRSKPSSLLLVPRQYYRLDFPSCLPLLPYLKSPTPTETINASGAHVDPT